MKSKHSIDIVVNVFDLPEPEFNCPTAPIGFCGGEVNLNAMDANVNTATNSSGVWSGSGAALINTMGTATITDDVLDPLLGELNIQYNLVLTIESADGCIVESEECSFTIVSNCAANGGKF